MVYVAREITKRYRGVHALRGVDLDLLPSEVHALLGANGAGKSTLVKTLVGAVTPTSGRLELDGAPVRLGNVREADRKGITYVSQDLSLFPDLDVLENLFMQREPTRLRLVSRRAMRERARPVLSAMGLDVTLDARVGDLRVGDQQLLEIARALLGNVRILVLDEPTSSLTAHETERLLGVVRELRSRGVSVLYVSHFLEEVFAIADVITVLRNGERVASRLRPTDSSIDAVAQLITGDSGPRSAAGQVLTRVDQGPVAGALQVSGLAIRGQLAPTSFRAEAGEVVGLAGLDGAGHEAVLRVLAGRLAPTSGAVRFPDGSPRARSVAKAVRRGIAYVTGDRRRGLVLDQMVWENVAMVSALGRQDRGIAWNAARFHGVTADWIDRLSIAGAQPATRVDTLSGGNQQKVLLAAWLVTEPQVLLLDDPTRGVDIGAKAQIHRIVAEFAAEGRLVVVTSSDVEELAAICDRIIVFFRGRVRCELSRAELSAHRLLWAMNSPPGGLEADVRTEDVDVPR
jgi:ABC-type sugar transport system ATPase subunit